MSRGKGKKKITPPQKPVRATSEKQKQTPAELSEAELDTIAGGLVNTLSGGLVDTLPGGLALVDGETIAEMLAREAARTLVDPSSGQVLTLGGLYAAAGATGTGSKRRKKK